MSDPLPAPDLDAAAIVEMLELEPHPEGGFYRQTFRDELEHEGRSASTAIYYLLPEGAFSAWHRTDAAEVWHHYAGASLSLSVAATADDEPVTRVLGTDLIAGERPQLIVPANHWQTARPNGGWVLVGCTVAPGFEFAGFEMAPPGWEPGSR